MKGECAKARGEVRAQEFVGCPYGGAKAYPPRLQRQCHVFHPVAFMPWQTPETCAACPVPLLAAKASCFEPMRDALRIICDTWEPDCRDGMYEQAKTALALAEAVGGEE
jgi:hypothetical protein